MVNWCLDNMEECKGFHGILQNTWENGPSIISKVTDLWDLMNTDDSCYSDMELITEAERAAEDLMSIWGSVRGFDHKWDQTRQFKHMKTKDFWKKYKESPVPKFDIFGDVEMPSADDVYAYIQDTPLPTVGQVVEYGEDLGLF